jgi:hypothetical protein
MNKGRGTNVESSDSTGRTFLATRRAVLAAGSAVALGNLAGCAALDGLVAGAGAETVGTTEASPAAFYVGSPNLLSGGGAGEAINLYRSTPTDVRYVPPTIRAASRDIEIDGWSTSTTTKAQDYNAARSNKPTSIWWPDPNDEDADDDGIGTIVTVLDIERALVVYADAAIEAVENQLNDNARASLDAFIDATTTVRAILEDCSSETCTTVSGNADKRLGLAEDASDAVDAGKWDGARKSIQEARRIVQGDIDRIFDDLDSDGDGISDGTESLHDYLGGEPTIGEHFVVSLPDANVRGGGPMLAAELTPRRVLDYFTGERDVEGCARTDRAVAVHRALACRDLLSSRLDEDDRKQRHVAAFETAGGVVVTGATPAADVAEPRLRVSPDNSVSTVESLDSWGAEVTSGEATVSSVLVCPVVATPADCPCPMPALFHIRRIRHDEQVLYVGGWQLDDGALYENAATLLVADGPNIVAGATRADIEEGGVDLKQRGNDTTVRKKPGRTKYSNITLSAPYDPDHESLPAGAHPVCRDDGELYCWAVQSREALASYDTGDCDDRDERNTPVWSVVTALDAPVLHLVDAAAASNEVKFKAGSELSKAVN